MLRIIPCLLLSGCCCCWPFGGDDGNGFVSDYVERRVGEELGERLVEAATGAEDVQVGADGSVTITTPDGTFRAAEDEDGSFTLTNGDGTVMASGGPGSDAPADFPVAGFPGATVASTMDLPDGQMVTWTIDGRFEDVMAHVEAELQAHGDMVKASDMQTPDGRLVMYTVEDAKLTAMVSGTGDETMMMVTRAK